MLSTASLLMKRLGLQGCISFSFSQKNPFNALDSTTRSTCCIASSMDNNSIVKFVAVMCVTQVYNLPETVRESDVEKLSFAVELADAFFSDPKVHSFLGVCTYRCM